MWHSRFANTSSREHIPWIAELLDSLQHLMIYLYFIVLPSIDRFFSRHKVHLNSGSGRKGGGAPNALQFFTLYSSQATTKEDCVAYHSRLKDWGHSISRFFQQIQITDKACYHTLYLPMFTRRPLFSISDFQVFNFTSSINQWTLHWSSSHLHIAAPMDSLYGTPWMEPLTHIYVPSYMYIFEEKKPW